MTGIKLFGYSLNARICTALARLPHMLSPLFQKSTIYQKILSAIRQAVLFSQSVSLTQYVVLSVRLSVCLSVCSSQLHSRCATLQLGHTQTTAPVGPFFYQIYVDNKSFKWLNFQLCIQRKLIWHKLNYIIQYKDACCQAQPKSQLTWAEFAIFQCAPATRPPGHPHEQQFSQPNQPNPISVTL